jgi:hypothetical protein
MEGNPIGNLGCGSTQPSLFKSNICLIKLPNNSYWEMLMVDIAIKQLNCKKSARNCGNIQLVVFELLKNKILIILYSVVRKTV